MTTKTGDSKNQHFCIFPSIKTTSVVGEGTRCCLIAVNHHNKCQINKWLLESYDEFFVLVHSLTGYQ